VPLPNPSMQGGGEVGVAGIATTIPTDQVIIPDTQGSSSSSNSFNNGVVSLLKNGVFAGIDFPYSHLVAIPPELEGPLSYVQPNLPVGIERAWQVMDHISGPSAKERGTYQNRAAKWITEFDFPQFSPTDSRFVQRYVLASLYYALNGPNWERALGWMGKEDICFWEHVCCLNLGRTGCLTSNDEINERRVTLTLGMYN
jgi:hypothetical protein